MKWIEKLKDRYNILLIILSVIFLIMSITLANLTIRQGAKYRERADTKRLKQIPITASRGEIRDKYGRLIAGNKPSFVVQIMKDEFKEKRNETALKLMSLLDEEGENYINEFPIDFNIIRYKEENIPSQFEDIDEEIVDTLIRHELVDDLMDTKFYNETAYNIYRFIPAKRAKYLLDKEDYNLPIEIRLDQTGSVTYTFDDVLLAKWQEEHPALKGMGPKSVIVSLLTQDRTTLKNLLKHPVVRGLVYDMLESQGLAARYKLDVYAYKYDEELRGLKRGLMDSFPQVTFTSDAKDDFIQIIRQSSLKDLLNKVYEGSEESETLIPAQTLFRQLEEKEPNLPLVLTVDLENENVIMKYKSLEEKEKFLEGKPLTGEVTPQDALIYLADKHGILDPFITSDAIKSKAQQVMLSNGINPKISIAKWEYVPMISKNSWLEKYKSIGVDGGTDAETAFKLLREEKYELDDAMSRYEARFIFIIDEQLNKQGYMAYYPINIAYGIKDVTVAKIKEHNIELPGVKVSVEPVRYYPYGNTAAHLIGHLGKISQSWEIEKYLKDPEENLKFPEKRYTRNDIIGKYGLEESFEEELNGVDGYRKVEVDVMGNTLNVLEEKKAIPGDTLYLTIDVELQKVAEAALKQALEKIQVAGEFESAWGNYQYKTEKGGRLLKNATSGSTVAIDVKNGEVLALANYPAFDPNLFATGISAEDYESLKPENEEDPLAPRPLYNIALQTAVQPGSTFKMITGLAGLDNGLSPSQKINSLGFIEIGNQTFGCWIWNGSRGMHGPTDLYHAIEESCNYYFYTLTLGENPKVSGQTVPRVDEEDIFDVARQFGLDDKTGIEMTIPSERSGGVPNPQSKISYTKEKIKKELGKEINSYVVEGKEFSKEELAKKVDTIVSWVDLEETLSRGQVRNKLIQMGLEPDKRVNDTLNLTDRIKYGYLLDASWKVADSFNVSIGQGDNAYTPIQMANYMATLANGGTKYKVSVIDNLESYIGNDRNYEKQNDFTKVVLGEKQNGENQTEEFLDSVKEGMRRAAATGTARAIFKDLPVAVGVKTGTAEKDGINPATGEPYDNYAWFVAFAPYDDPQIAVSTVIFQGGHGGYAGPVAKEIIAQYLGLNHENEPIGFKNKLVE